MGALQESERLVTGYLQLGSVAGHVGGCLRGEALLTAATWRCGFPMSPSRHLMGGVRWRVST